MDPISRTEHRTHCPFKGDATYWSVAVGGHGNHRIYRVQCLQDRFLEGRRRKVCGAYARQCGAHAACQPSGAVGDQRGMGCGDKPRLGGGLRTLVDVKWYLHIAAAGHHSSPSPHDCRHCLLLESRYDVVNRVDLDLEVVSGERLQTRPIVSVFQSLGAIRHWIGPEE
jgi:hypothetical protein